MRFGDDVEKFKAFVNAQQKEKKERECSLSSDRSRLLLAGEHIDIHEAALGSLIATQAINGCIQWRKARPPLRLLI